MFGVDIPVVLILMVALIGGSGVADGFKGDTLTKTAVIVGDGTVVADADHGPGMPYLALTAEGKAVAEASLNEESLRLNLFEAKTPYVTGVLYPYDDVAREAEEVERIAEEEQQTR